jgi:hypothetical protein
MAKRIASAFPTAYRAACTSAGIPTASISSLKTGKLII